jgi:TrmH family RNA methyltransferase
LLEVQAALILFCIEVQDPGNLGTIIRTADAAGATGVILSRGTVDLFNSKVVRASMGSIFHLPIVRIKELVETLDKLKKNQLRIVAADHRASQDYHQADLSGPAAILVGNEGAGLPNEVLRLADETVKIPMPGQAESLNVGVASGIILYEALRQRQYGRKD